ncbi:hypothetical protein CGLO_14500 [Colletotrichum gloeosporioides Cg-14]|uniref:Uncharacterized protein n=1 Tax=Colletotrichum gloeosporioides (strain Cg-14) TaxID=1237896 RepID=T0LDS1_COLGC|nr:hypothetical protein CGLO_14500 [Colletotrichum gloeosporioides Cg-14]
MKDTKVDMMRLHVLKP